MTRVLMTTPINTNAPAPPRILLIGAGPFGREHLKEWLVLTADGEAKLAGVVVSSSESRDALAPGSPVPVYARVDEELLSSVDGVDIVTPSATHAALVRQCLPWTAVLCEKPLALSASEAKELAQEATAQGRTLMVGHLFRFHPSVIELKRRASMMHEWPRGIEGAFVNPEVTNYGGVDANFELLHLLDIIDFILDSAPEITLGRRKGLINQLSLRYPGGVTALLRVGWGGSRKIRFVKFSYSNREIVCDLMDNTVVISGRDNEVDKIILPGEPLALRAELRAFANAITLGSAATATGEIGSRIVGIAHACRPRRVRSPPRVAVIGGGIFGATCALELAPTCDVVLFERHSDLMTEVSFNNQWRHHSGFHYPRSYDTIQEIKAAKNDFESRYKEVVRSDFPAYYCTSASGVEIPADRYLAACQSNNLNFTMEAPPENVLDRSKVSLCVRSDEAIYDFERFRRLVGAALAESPSIEVRLRTDVVSGVLMQDTRKRLTFNAPGGTREESVDFLINATYANRNLVSKWFGFPQAPLRFDLYELLLLRLPLDQICVTVLDGPFTSLVGTGEKGIFLLSHIHQSVLKSVVPDDGMPPRWGEVQSNRRNMLRHSMYYFPVLAKAEVVESRCATRAVNAYAKDFDARPTVVSDHGFGCWSVLGGKIVTCVTNALEIAREINALAASPHPLEAGKPYLTGDRERLSEQLKHP